MSIHALHKVQDQAISSLRYSKQAMQAALLATLQHAWKCGDYTQGNRLVAAFGDGKDDANNKSAIVAFFVQFGGLSYDKETNTFTGWKGADFIKDNFQNAKSTIWTTLRYKPEQAKKTFNINDKVANLLASLENEGKKGGITELNSETVKALVTYLAKHDHMMVAEALASTALAEALGIELVVTTEVEKLAA